MSKVNNAKLDIKTEREKIDGGGEILLIKVSRFFIFELEPYIFFTPFELIDLILSFEIQAIKSNFI